MIPNVVIPTLGLLRLRFFQLPFDERLLWQQQAAQQRFVFVLQVLRQAVLEPFFRLRLEPQALQPEQQHAFPPQCVLRFDVLARRLG